MQLTRSLVIVMLAGASARGDTSFASKIQVYSDSDHTQVVSPIVDAQLDVDAKTNVSLGYTADVVSSASVDIVSQASPTTIHDTRHQVAAGASRDLGPLTLRGGYSYSRENDYQSHTLSFGASKELFDKNTTLALGYGLSLNAVGRAHDMNFERSLDVHSGSLSWTQTVSPRLATQVTYELAYASGFQASPYRYVPVRVSPDAAPDFWVPETDPETRFRHALVLGANRAVGGNSAVQGDYRIYHDTWGITSHTIGARYIVDLSHRLELRVRERFYTQTAASFYQSLYAMPAKYITFDRELSPLWSETVGAKLAYRFSDRVEGELKLDAFYYSYADFAPLASRTGANAGAGVSLTY